MTRFVSDRDRFDRTAPGRSAKPEWSLTGAVVDWPDGQPAALEQSPWLQTPLGWTGVITIPRGHGDGVRFHTIHLFIDDAVPHEIAPIRAQNLIALRLRAAGVDAPPHLGEVHVSSPEFRL